jgi:hypothetical protein
MKCDLAGQQSGFDEFETAQINENGPETGFHVHEIGAVTLSTSRLGNMATSWP